MVTKCERCGKIYIGDGKCLYCKEEIPPKDYAEGMDIPDIFKDIFGGGKWSNPTGRT